MKIYQIFNTGMFVLLASAYIISVTSSRPVSQGKSCEVLVRRNCDSKGVTSLAELYKRVFSFLRFTRADVTLCHSKKTLNCVHGKCGDSRCECLPCWKGESCDVLDNKHVPKFEQPIYDVQISEDVSVGSTVTVVSAVDHDSKVCEGRSEHCVCAEVTYNIETGNEAGYFEINSKTGVLSVGKSLATKEKKAFELEISALNNKDNSGTKSITKVRILVVQEETGSRKRRSIEVHHRSRRAILQGQSTLIPTFKPVVPNVTYYNVGDEINFVFNLSHNASSVTKNPVKSLVVTFNSKYLKPKQNSIVAVAGSVSISGSVTYNETSATFQVGDLVSGQALAVEFSAIVKSTIHPLANLYFTADITGTDSGGGSHYPSGPHPSVPTLYAVFPKVTLQRTSVTELCVGSVTKYKLTIEMPKLNFALLVELSTAINDFSFMKIDDVKFVAVGSNIGTGDGGKKEPIPSFYKSPDVDFYDRAVLDFGNLTVSDASSQNKIEIEFNVTIKDHPSLANASKHWVGAGMRSGYQMLWVGQEAISVCKNDPTIVGTFSTLNDTKTKRYFIGDKLYVNWEVAHNNNSYEAAQGVSITFTFKGLKFLSGSYLKPSTSSILQTLTANAEKNETAAISESSLAQDAKISGSMELEVSQDISPLKELDIVMTLAFKNTKNEPKDPRDYKPSPPFVAGVPIFNLKHNSSSNTIRIGGRTKFSFTIILFKMVSPLKIEVILPVNESSIMAVTSMKVVSVGTNIEKNSALEAKTATFKSTVNSNDSLYDRATIDFGTVTSVNGETSGPDNKITIEFEIIVNDHANVTNGSKHWVGVGVRGGDRMMWIGEVALIADVPADRRPVLSITCTCTTGAMQCQDNTTLTRDNVVEYNATVEHHPNSQGYAENVKVTWMIPPYIKFKSGSTSHTADIVSDNPKGVPQFEFQKGLKFLDKMSFSFMALLDPDKMMPAGKSAAFSPIQLSYAGQSTGSKYSAPLVPVNFFFTIPGSSSEAQTRTCTPPPELTGYDKAIILDKANNILYICRMTQDSLKASCFYTSDKGESWKGVNKQVGFIVGLTGNDLYAIARNKCAYLHQAKRDGVWYAVPSSVWSAAKGGAEGSVKKVADSYANTADPTSDYQMTATDLTVWGTNKKGVYVKPSGGSFTLKAQWTCCGN